MKTKWFVPIGRETQQFIWIIVALLLALVLAISSAAEPPRPNLPPTPATDADSPEEVVPGISLDGAIIIDEDVWLLLVGEPGRHMREARASYLEKKYAEASESLRKASSFLLIAEDNAVKLAKPALKNAARELHLAAKQAADGSLESADKLDPIFARAHHAMARHHALKAAEALADNRSGRAGNYLRSAVNHFQRAAEWSDHTLSPASKTAANSARTVVVELLKATPEIGQQAAEAINRLRQGIAKLGKSIEPSPLKPLERKIE